MRNIHRKCVIHESSPKSGTSWIWPERKWTIFVINISLSLNDLVNRQRKALVFWGCPLCHVRVSTVSDCPLCSLSVFTVSSFGLSTVSSCLGAFDVTEVWRVVRHCPRPWMLLHTCTCTTASALIIATSLDYKRSKSSDGYTMGQVHLTASFLMPGVRW